MDCSKKIKPLIPEDEIHNIMAIDLGVNNLATCVTNININPLIVNGKPLKSVNQWYNKQRAYLYSSLRINKKKNEGIFSSSRLEFLDKKRHLKVKDYMHKASKIISNYAIENNIHKVVVGYNQGWKERLDYFRKDAKQNFINIPFLQFLNTLEYKLKAEGIRFERIEESYTSKSSFLDKDVLPKYAKNDTSVYTFSGKRVTRGLYVSNKNITINADVNGACNILRKCLKEDIELDHKVLSNPRKVNIKCANKNSTKKSKKIMKKQIKLNKMKAKRSLRSPLGIADRTANCVAGQSGLVCTSELLQTGGPIPA